MGFWRDLFGSGGTARDGSGGERDHLELARESVRELLDDERLPDGVRETLSDDYRQLKALLDKLDHGHVHIAAFGRVSTGKSSLLNALTGAEHFPTSALHGETRVSAMQPLNEVDVGGVFVIDTPGIDEAGGDAREALAAEVAGRADLILFVLDADLTAAEYEALRSLVGQGRPVIVVLNKTDRYTADETEALLEAVRLRTDGLVDPRYIVPASAAPRPERVVWREADGSETESERPREPDVRALRGLLWDLLEREGKTLAALNASLFASDLSDSVAERILEARRGIAERVVRTYCLAKGATVALNPVPVADLFAAAFVDIGMVVHLSRVYALPVARGEARSLVAVIMTEAAALMGTVWAVHVASSALKVGTGGLSTFLTAGAQGAIAWYSTYVVGKVADRYLAEGKSWGDGGPKQVVSEILASLDRDSILAEARDELRTRLQRRRQ